ncbi:MAG: hypothetical protein WAM70_00840, partial [Pyrinomonadaceae bacterium]
VSLFPLDDELGMGGGWCNHCGCWMRHGCDPNGNCSLGHHLVCYGTGMACDLHAGTGCISTGATG